MKNNIRDELESMIAAVREKRNALDTLLASLESTVQALGNLPAGVLELLAPSLREQTAKLLVPDSNLFNEPQEELGTGKLTQYGRISRFLAERKNQPTALAEIATATEASRSAVANVLYRTHKEFFVSHAVAGSKKLKAWGLRPDVFERIVQRRNRPSPQAADHPEVHGAGQRL